MYFDWVFLKYEEFFIGLIIYLGLCFDRIKCLINVCWMKISIEYSMYMTLYLVDGVEELKLSMI